MKLKKLVIQGFKSFADRITLDFHEGITCIVGPNGCGKSNIADAIRWVLGEQSAKSLRGGKMPDVIFAGADTRKPGNFSEVTIVFDEVNGALALPFEEVAITRKLHRSGESEYFINNELVRLKDVQHLFLDSGVGKNNFSIFEQGKIDQIIQFSPEERRYVFDEAAGIVRFLQKKKEALRKLEDVTLNVSRLEDIHGEVKKQIEHLKTQAEEATIYKGNKERLEALEKGILTVRFENYEKKRSDLLEKEEKAKTREKILLSEQKKSHEEWLEKKKVGHHLDQNLQKTREAFLEKQGERELKAQSQKNSVERLSELEKKIEKNTKEVSHLNGERKHWKEELEGLKKEKEQYHQETTNQRKVVQELSAVFQKTEKDLQNIRLKQGEAQKLRLQMIQKSSSFDVELKQLKYRLESHQEKKFQFLKRLESLSLLAVQKQEECEGKKATHHKTLADVDAAKNHLVSFEPKLKELQGAIEKEEQLLKETREDLQKSQGRHSALVHLKEEFAGFSKGGKLLLQASKDKKSSIFGLLKGLYEFITIDPKEESLTNAALRAYAETLVVQNEEDLRVILAYAEKEGIADFSLFCSAFSKKGAIQEHFLSRLQKTEDLEETVEKISQGKEGWYQKGYYFDTRGVLFFGKGKEQTIFTREAELRTLSKKIEKLESEKNALEVNLQKLHQQKSELTSQRALADQTLRKLEMKSVETNFELQKTLQEKDRLLKEEKQVRDEVESIEKMVTSLLERQKQLETEWQTIRKQEEEIIQNNSELESKLGKESEEWNKKREHLRKEELKLAEVEEKWNKASYAFNLLEVKEQETERLVKRLTDELEQCKKQAVELTKARESIGDEIESVKQELEESLKSKAHYEDLVKTCRLELLDMEKKKAEVDKELKEIEGSLHQVGIQLAHIETGQAAIVAELQERFQTTAEEVKESLPPYEGTLEKMEKEIKQLRNFLENSKMVNLTAIEACKEQEERSQFLTVQLDELVNGKQELLDLIASLDKESRILFKTTFEAIRENFKKNFEILFRGGAADLELLDAEDILDAGIEISAKPPGKQMRSLSLLSGGEKCLTAMALLFAIFEVKSSPFCILDEIDAPLDDSNVERFLNVVKAFVDRSQFIIVTHNKRTMALGDRLYGVSMQEKGVSKILSMEFAKEKDQEPVLVA